MLALARDHSRKPQLVRMQRTTDLGCPAPTDISATQDLHLRLREDCRRGGGQKACKSRMKSAGRGSFRNDRSVHSRYLNNMAASTIPIDIQAGKGEVSWGSIPRQNYRQLMTMERRRISLSQE